MISAAAFQDVGARRDWQRPIGLAGALCGIPSIDLRGYSGAEKPGCLQRLMGKESSNAVVQPSDVDVLPTCFGGSILGLQD